MNSGRIDLQGELRSRSARSRRSQGDRRPYDFVSHATPEVKRTSPHIATQGDARSAMIPAASDLRSEDRIDPGDCMTDTEANRRPIAARGSAWARALAGALARSAVTPNQISVASVAFAAAGAALLAWWPTWAGLLLCALCIQFRLIC